MSSERSVKEESERTFRSLNHLGCFFDCTILCNFGTIGTTEVSQDPEARRCSRLDWIHRDSFPIPREDASRFGHRVRFVRLLGLEVGGRDLLSLLTGMGETTKFFRQPTSGGSGAQ